MLFRVSNIRNLLILIIVNILIYTILLRWIFSANSSSNRGDKIIYSAPISQRNQAPLSPSIFKDAPMHDELVGLQYRSIR